MYVPDTALVELTFNSYANDKNFITAVHLTPAIITLYN